MALQEDDPYRFRRILAITFTNKAAAEMKERVIHVLHDISAENGPQKEANKTLLQSLSEELSLAPMILRDRAGKTLSGILHQYSDFAIGTIDSFMHRVVRTFAHDLHLPVNFSVELDQEVLLRQAIEQVLDKVGDNDAITRALVGFTEHRTDEEKSMSIQDELFKTGKDLLNEQTAMIVRKLNKLSVNDFLEIRIKLNQECRDLETEIRKVGKLGMEILSSADIDTADFYQGRSGFGKYLQKAANMEQGVDLTPNSYVRKTLFEETWTAKKASPELRDKIDSVKDQLLQVGNALVDIWAKSGAEYLLNGLLRDSIYSIALLNEISRMIDQIRDEQFIVHISEFNRRVADIVFNEPAPFIFERLGEKYNHYLIDEFQDTSVLQWQNLLPLIQNGLSENHPSLIVGDGKQAIYRFRGGEVEQFAKLPEPYPSNLKDVQLERYTLLRNMFRPKTLDTNYRSKPEIIEFNNRFYNYIQQEQLPLVFNNVYDDQEQKSPAGKVGGYIELNLAPAGLERAERDAYHLEKSLSIIQELIDTKGYRFRDIALLTRNNYQGTLLAGYLLNNDIPVISSESLLVKNASEVGFLISWMHILIGSNTSLHLLSVCSFLQQKRVLPFTTLDELLHHVKMDERSVLREFGKHQLNVDLIQWRRLSLLECCFSICECFRIDVQSNTYLQFFLEAVWGSGRNSALDIPLFLEYWEEKKNKLSISLPQDANAVRIMTVHKSKGLQFPVVILPFAYGEFSKTKTEWIDDEEVLPLDLLAARVSLTQNLKSTRLAQYVTNEEDRRTLDAINLLYVATTRPEDALYILSGHSGRNGALQAGWETFLEVFAQTEKPDDFPNGQCHWGDPNFINQRADESISESASVVHHYPVSKWQKRITISRQAPRHWDTDKNEPSALSLGKLVHRALSLIETADQIDVAIEQLKQEGALSFQQEAEMKQLIQSVIEHPQLQEYYAGNQTIFNERALLLPDGKLAIPDRVIERDGAVTVVDYKTGMKKEEHKVQIANYSRHLRAMNYKDCKAFLVYLGKSIEIEEVLIPAT